MGAEDGLNLVRLWGPVEPCPTPVLFHSAATRACCPFLAVQASFVKKQQQENVVVVWVVFFFPSPLKLCVVLRIWHRLYSKSLHLEQPQCELGASHCLILMQPKEGLGRGKWSRKVAKEAQGLGPNIPLHMLDAQGTQCGPEKSG